MRHRGGTLISTGAGDIDRSERVTLGARELYVSAAPSETAVGFCSSRGFVLVDEVDEEPRALEPEGIHMIETL